MSSPHSNIIMGWFAACVGAIGFGSFAVPIKGDTANSVDIDPLVMQSYKSLMCFLTSWLVISMGQEVTFTWWGIISGLFWVPGGALNIFAIRNAGLAVSQGIVASSIVMVSFIWGNIIFHEPVKSQVMAYFAVVLIMTGLYGMSYYSAADSVAEDDGADLHKRDDEEEQKDLLQNQFDNESTTTTEPMEISGKTRQSDRVVLVCGNTYSRRNLGLCSALLCGTWGGSCLVPMHYSKGDTNGLGYVISFSVGAMVVTLLMWILRLLYSTIKMKSLSEAFAVLPSFHFKVMWLPGATAGALWSLGNVGSIVAVEQLGQGVGYPASQSALLVAGLWGIFYYKEVNKPITIMKWFTSASVTITGILLLGYESSPAGPGRR